MPRPPVRPTSLPTLLIGAALLWVAWLPACEEAPGDSAEDGPAPGRLVAAGGGLSGQNEAVYRAILEAREGDGPVCVIPTAGASPERSMEGAAGRIDSWAEEGAARGILISSEEPERARDPEVAEEIRGCSGFFFTGGVQSRIVDTFLPDGEPTPAYEALMERFREGAVVAGSSAGAAMMSKPMIASGNSGAAFREGVGEDGGVRVTRGMGFLQDVPLDQHFLARGRIGRLIVATLADPERPLGVGIDEDTGLVVDGDAAWVAGTSGVVVVDASEATRGDGGPAHVEGLRLELLGPGDTLRLSDRRVIPTDGKRPVAELALDTPDPEDLEVAPAELEPENLFERWAFLHLLHDLAGDGSSSITAHVEGYRVELRPGSDFRGIAHPEPGVEGTPWGLSVGPIVADIVPVD